MNACLVRCPVALTLFLLSLPAGASKDEPEAAAAGGLTERHSPYHLLDHLARSLVLIENEYVDPVDRARLIRGALKGMVAELDPHSAYLPREDYSIFQSDTEGRFGGIGVEVDFANDKVTVIAPIEGSPAARAGILPGDEIVAIDHQSVADKQPSDLVRQMRGPPGTQVLVTVERPKQEQLLQFKLEREVITVASVAKKLLKRFVGYFRIKAFQNGTHTELLESLQELRAEAGGPLSGVVLDLRNNPGGLVTEARAVADEFLTGGVIYTTRHRGKIRDEARAARSGSLRRGPVVVLVNEYSASAAELVAGALQDNRRAIVVGMPTFGKGSVQSIIDLPQGAGLRLTTMRYYTPLGQEIQATGIQPDVQVKASFETGTLGDALRESDLANHLPAEQSDGAQPSTVQSDAGGASSPEASPEATHLGVSRQIPTDPTESNDAALSVGYQIVTGVLQRR